MADFREVVETQFEPAEEQKLPFAWELEKDGVQSYAIGTMHYSDVNYQRALDDVLQNADQLMVEINPFAFNDEDKQKLVAVHAAMQSCTLKDKLSHLTPGERKELATIYQMTESELEAATFSSLRMKVGTGPKFRPE